VVAALDWIDQYGDMDGDGFVEYHRRTPRGLANQGWKDSFDSVFHADGVLAEGPIALCEVQCYVHAAQLAGARLARCFSEIERAERLEHQARELQERFQRLFWCEEIASYALALDGEKQPCRVRTSNAGHALFTGTASMVQAEKLATTLMSKDCFSGWGIRTTSSRELRYNPMSYHNGSVWPHDNAIIARGLARYGFAKEALAILSGVFEASLFFDLNRLPELFCGL
jgi:glycogen debranching enzyme